MAGQVKHAKIFSGIVPDFTLLSVLTKLGPRIPMRSSRPWLKCCGGRASSCSIRRPSSSRCWPPRDPSRREPSADEREDLDFGYRMADAIAALDIGQTIVVKDKAVVAVEAMEGTDAVIRRAGEIAGPGTRIVKVAKPKQDMRFDVPVVGVATIEMMKAAGATAISIDAGRTLIVDGEWFFEAANAAGIAVVGRRALEGSRAEAPPRRGDRRRPSGQASRPAARRDRRRAAGRRGRSGCRASSAAAAGQRRARARGLPGAVRSGGCGDGRGADRAAPCIALPFLSAASPCWSRSR